jgi:isoamylase
VRPRADAHGEGAAAGGGAPAALPGRPHPLGATWDGAGTNFALASAHADAVELCLFDGEGAERRVALAERAGAVWHGYLEGVGPGQRYAYRVHGPFAPGEGHWFNPAKLLIDPYAKAIEGDVRYDQARLTGFAADDRGRPDSQDDAAAIPKSVVVDRAFAWEGDARLETPWSQTVIYEAHVKGFTMRNPAVREDLRGTYAGLASEEAIGYLRSLGVSAVELLPVHHSADEEFLRARGLRNYWGYSSIGFFAPHAPYAATGHLGEQVHEFKGMVKALHSAGIEVILDVVFNHTAEGGPDGPTLAFRGIDNASYYRLDPGDRAGYSDVTGTGNSLDPSNRDVLALIMDSLRYWVVDCHVDGFRFDLASALLRDGHDPNAGAAFLDLVYQDPVVSQVKLIAEPWDLGEGGYQLGGFPGSWREWNDRYRDTMRDFWRGAAGRAEFASRFTGSSDIFAAPGRAATASLNFVTCHDGFTLADLVTYEQKNNLANLEDNADGSNDNRSWNLGVEGPSDDPAIRARRLRQQRNFLATLLLSEGVPMLLGGDEFGRSQQGNNNPWCQDNELSWFDWEFGPDGAELLAFTRALVALRRGEPVFRRSRFLTDGAAGSQLPDVWWFGTDGRKIASAAWPNEPHSLGLFLNGRELGERGAGGEPIGGDSFCLLINAAHEPVRFKLPPVRFGRSWQLELSTAIVAPDEQAISAGSLLTVEELSLLLLRRVH